MTNEEMQNTVQFILEQQAQLTVKVDKLAEAQLNLLPVAGRPRLALESLDRLSAQYQPR